MNNCSYELWDKRYTAGHYDGQSSSAQRAVLRSKAPAPTAESVGHERALSEGSLRLRLRPQEEADSTITLFGVTEDVTCPDEATRHILA